MQRIGEVTAVHGDRLEVTFCRPADCGKCHACSGNRAQTCITVQGRAAVGDAAVVEMPDSTVMKASLMAYVLPGAGLIGGVVLGSVLFGGDAAGVLGGLTGLAVTLGIVAVGEKKRRNDASWQPQLLQVLAGEGAKAAANDQ